jgi:hypothetical protein
MPSPSKCFIFEENDVEYQPLLKSICSILFSERQCMSIGKLFFLFTCVFFCSLECIVSSSHGDCTFDLAAAGNSVLFVASAEANAEPEYSVARFALTRTSANAYTSELVGLVKPTAFVNHRTPTQKKSLNPLYEQTIDSFALYKTAPLVAFRAPDAEGHCHSVAIIQDVESGNAVLVNAKPFGDATGAVTRNIVKVCGGVYVRESSNVFVPTTEFGFVFAAVTPSDSSSWVGQDAAGIAVAQVMSDSIVPLAVGGVGSGPSAVAVPHSAIQIGDVGTITGITALCWNDRLHRLYVAAQTEDGGVAVLVGRLEIPSTARTTNTTALQNIRCVLTPCIAAADGTNDADDWVDSDFVVARKDADISLQRIAVMNTSSGYDYFVAQRGDAVYALPVVSSGSESTVGMLAQKSDYTAAATAGSEEQLYTAAESSVFVGCGDVPAAITALHVYGDSVCVSCAGDTDATRGIFMSQAIFARDGKIVGWSPWRCLLATENTALDFVRDQLGRIQYLSGDGETFDTVATQVWGSCNQNGLWGGALDDATVGLVYAINTFFPTARGGVQTVAAVRGRSDTAWHNTTARLASDTQLLVFGGRNRCAVALTAVEGELFRGADATTDSHFITYDLADDDLALGMLSAVAVSRSDAEADEGWIFVGGTDGLAVLRKASGEGWNALDDLQALRDDEFSFKKITKSDGSDFTHIRQIVTDENYFYVVCPEGVYRCAYNSDAFGDEPTETIGEELVAAPYQLLGASYETIFSVLILGEYALLGTSKGLWLSDVAAGEVVNARGTGGWIFVPIEPAGTDSFGVCSQLTCVPGFAPDEPCMVRVLTADVSLNIASLYSVSIPQAADLADEGVRAGIGAIAHTSETVTRRYVTLLGRMCEHCYTDGGVIFDASSKHHQFLGEGFGLLRVLKVSPSIGALDAWAESVQPVLDTALSGSLVSDIACDEATGTILLSGSWGLQILQ